MCCSIIPEQQSRPSSPPISHPTQTMQVPKKQKVSPTPNLHQSSNLRSSSQIPSLIANPRNSPSNHFPTSSTLLLNTANSLPPFLPAAVPTLPASLAALLGTPGGDPGARKCGLWKCGRSPTPPPTPPAPRADCELVDVGVSVRACACAFVCGERGRDDSGSVGGGELRPQTRRPQVRTRMTRVPAVRWTATLVTAGGGWVVSPEVLEVSAVLLGRADGSKEGFEA